MSEFTNKSELRIQKLSHYMLGLINNENGTELLKKYEILETQFLPEDVLLVFDKMFDLGIDISDIKKASNKLFNILYKQFSEPQAVKPEENSILDYLLKNNLGLKDFLLKTKAFIKEININISSSLIEELNKSFKKILSFTSHYTLIQNILFSEIEKKWTNSKCVKILWSIQDDVKKNCKKTIEILENTKFDLAEFNKYSSLVYFNTNTLIFREEKILYPILMKTFTNVMFEEMLNQASEIELEYVKIPLTNKNTDSEINENLIVKLSTGELNLSQLELIFKYLPVDITFVDENDKVRFFSDPLHRIFPRSKSIIGRSVQNCHPHESIEIVNKIVSSFKNNEKQSASFWIHMGPKYVLIQYFAVRDEHNNYKGVLEVSQEISEIQKITGDKKLLDW